jgi:hypothetical protein
MVCVMALEEYLLKQYGLEVDRLEQEHEEATVEAKYRRRYRNLAAAAFVAVGGADVIDKHIIDFIPHQGDKIAYWGIVIAGSQAIAGAAGNRYHSWIADQRARSAIRWSLANNVVPPEWTEQHAENNTDLFEKIPTPLEENL